ncbi:MAG: hypothetical protein P8M67_00220 [Opitutales bacterium]|nr:hypothetical protein [Opitutales bacterium]
MEVRDLQVKNLQEFFPKNRTWDNPPRSQTLPEWGNNSLHPGHELSLSSTCRALGKKGQQNLVQVGPLYERKKFSIV